MEDAIQKADVLIEALRWIREFRGKVTVIKLGGSVMENPVAITHLLLDVLFMETVGMRPVLILCTILLESLFLNTVRYENDKLEAYMKKLSSK